MIDKENEIFTIIKYGISSLCTNASTTFQSSPSSFPYVYVNQTNNSGADYDLGGNENATEPYITIQIFTNGTTAKSTAKKISQLVDKQMVAMGFRRNTGYFQQDNLIDNSVFCYMAIYKRLLGSGDIIQGISI